MRALIIAFVMAHAAVRTAAMHQEYPDVPPRWKIWLVNAAFGLLFGIAALIASYEGVDYQMSLHCRDAANPAVYGIEFCKPPPRTPVKSRGPLLFTRAADVRYPLFSWA